MASPARAHATILAHHLYDFAECEHRVALECVMASTDPVALDRVGSDIVDQLRVAHRMGTLEARGLPPRYIEQGQAMGLGIADRARIQTRVVAI